MLHRKDEHRARLTKGVDGIFKKAQDHPYGGMVKLPVVTA